MKKMTGLKNKWWKKPVFSALRNNWSNSMQLIAPEKEMHPLQISITFKPIKNYEIFRKKRSKNWKANKDETIIKKKKDPTK